MASLRTVFTMALQDAAKSFESSALQDETQVLVHAALKNLSLVVRAVESSAMFSPNESLDDLSTSSIPYLTLDYVAAALTERLRTAGHRERMRHILDSQRHLHAFTDLVHQYGLVSKLDQNTFFRKSSELKHPTTRRELKIQQLKAEKDAKNQLEILFRKTSRSFTSDNELLIIQSMFPPPHEADDHHHLDEEYLRDTYMLVIRLIWMRSQTQLESLNNELELLRAAPAFSPSSQPNPEPSDDTTWRLDSTPIGGPDGRGPLIDPNGRPLRPFTFLPSHPSSDRASHKARVFRPDHTLPTMTIDDYLDKERQMGNIISGGGPQSLNAPTESEQLAIDSEIDGTLLAETKAEEKRQKDERWARYTDLHPKGEGNTMNKG